MRGCKGHNDSARLKIIGEITRVMSWNESEPTTESTPPEEKIWHIFLCVCPKYTIYRSENTILVKCLIIVYRQIPSRNRKLLDLCLQGR